MLDSGRVWVYASGFGLSSWLRVGDLWLRALGLGLYDPRCRFSLLVRSTVRMKVYGLKRPWWNRLPGRLAGRLARDKNCFFGTGGFRCAICKVIWNSPQKAL